MTLFLVRGDNALRLELKHTLFLWCLDYSGIAYNDLQECEV